MNNLDKQYTDLLNDILDNGVQKGDRTGTGTISVFGRQIRHKMSEGFPLITTKKMPFRVIATELVWFLKGGTNIQWLIKHGCNIWNGDAHKAYVSKCSANDEKWNKWMRDNGDNTLSMYPMEEFIEKIKTDAEFAERWGDLGPIYGKQWRNWGPTYEVEEGWGKYTDQIKVLVDTLKTNPDSRRMMVNAWNVDELSQMTLPPCHYGFQVYTKELTLEERSKLCMDKYNFCVSNDIGHVSYDAQGIPKRSISLLWNQRSVDTFLGLPFNIASYGLLLEILAKEVNMVSDELIGNLGDTHLYLNHLDQAKEQIGTELSDEQTSEILKELDEKTYAEYIEAVRAKKECVKNQLYEEAYALKTREIVLMDKLKALGIPQITRQPYPLTKLLFKDHLDGFDSIIDIIRAKDFILDDYKSHGPIKAPLSN